MNTPPTITITYERVAPDDAGEPHERGFYQPGGGYYPIPAGLHGAAFTEWCEETGNADPVEYDDSYDTDDGTPDYVAWAVATAREYNTTEPSGVPWYPGTWYHEHDGTTDYLTGVQTYMEIHLNGFPEADERAVYARLTGRSA